MKPIVVGFSGRLASGKTTLSTEIAARLDWPRVSFGDYVRDVQRCRGTSDAPADLQELGASLIQEIGWERFCSRVLAQVDWTPEQCLVVDGIRHAEVLAALRRLVTPANILHVHIDVSDPKRQARLAARGESLSQSGAERRDDHSTEVQAIRVLPQIADLVVDGDRPSSDVVQRTLEWICRQ